MKSAVLNRKGIICAIIVIMALVLSFAVYAQDFPSISFFSQVDDAHSSLIGLLLITFGLGLLVAEFFFLGGILALSGFIAFLLGIMILVQADKISFKLAFAFSMGLAAVTAVFLLLALNLFIRSRYRPIVSGREELINSIGEIVSINKDQTLMRLRGELWEVSSDKPLILGNKVQVMSINGLLLKVQPVPDSSKIDN